MRSSVILLVSTLVLCLCYSALCDADLKNLKISVEEGKAIFHIELNKKGRVNVVMSPKDEEVSLVNRSNANKIHHEIIMPYLKHSTEYNFSVISKRNGQMVILEKGSFHTPVSLNNEQENNEININHEENHVEAEEKNEQVEENEQAEENVENNEEEEEVAD